MKNTLAENMLRFAPKNLKANDIKTLKRLAEQTDIVKKPYAPLDEQLTYNAVNTILTATEPGVKWLYIPTNPGTPIITMPAGSAIASATIAPNNRLIACKSFKITNSPENEGTATSTAGQIFITQLQYRGPRPSNPKEKDPNDTGFDPLPYTTNSMVGLMPSVTSALKEIGKLLRNNKLNPADKNTMKVVATFIMNIKSKGISDFSDYNQMEQNLISLNFSL
jgi:hypothetical protein